MQNKRIRRELIISGPGKFDWISLTEDRPLEEEKRTVIFCHGISGEKIGPQKLFVLLAEELVKKNSSRVLRFDFRGSGLSSGDFEETTFDSMLEDALFVAAFSQAEQILWIGVSTGALIALMSSAKRNKKERVIAISNGFAENPHLCLQEENGKVSLREGQFFLSKAFFSERLSLHPRTRYFPFCPSIDCILGSQDAKHFSESQSLVELGVSVQSIMGADHLFTEPAYRKQLLHLVSEMR